MTLTTKAPTGRHGRWFVEFQEETSQAAGSDRDVGPSSRGAADVDCGASRFKVVKFTVFEGPDFTGALLLDLGKRTEWRSPEPGTVMDRVLAAACGRTKIPARGREAVAAPPGPGPPAQPPAPRPPTLTEVAQIVAPAAAPAAVGRAYYAQLASLPSAEAARRAWEDLKGAAPGILDDHLGRLAVAIVRSRRVYRVLAGGFGTKAQAETVCKALARLSARCFVRPGDTTVAQ